MFALGQDFFAAGMLDRAESVFQELLVSNSKWIGKAAICESLRTIYEQTQEWHKAIEATECCKKNQKKNTNNSEVGSKLEALITHYYCELADESLQKGNLHEVDGYIVKAKKSHKQSTRLMSLQGDIALHQKQYKDALTHYISAVQQDSRLLSLLFEKMNASAKNAGEIQFLQKKLLVMHQKQADNNIFEAILHLANEYGSDNDVDKLVDLVLNKKTLSIKSILKATSYVRSQEEIANQTENNHGLGLIKIHQSLKNHLQGVPSFRCEHCGYKMHDYLWRCPACNHWDTVDQA